MIPNHGAEEVLDGGFGAVLQTSLFDLGQGLDKLLWPCGFQDEISNPRDLRKRIRTGISTTQSFFHNDCSRANPHSTLFTMKGPDPT